MIILSLRTDKPESEIGLFDDKNKLEYVTWPAHRQLAETVHHKLNELLESNGLTLNQIEGIAVYRGPGSFTGLRIGLSVANALAASLHVPIVGGGDDNWLEVSLEKLLSGEDQKLIQAEYGAPVHITQPKK